MLRRYILIFAIFMLIGGAAYDVYYLKVAKKRKIMKTLGRDQSPKSTSSSASNSAPKSSSTPTLNPGTSTPATTSEPGVEASKLDSDRVTLPLSDRLLKLVQGETSSSTPSNPNLPILNKSSFADVPRSNRNPFFTAEEERTIKSSNFGRTQSQFVFQTDKPLVEPKPKLNRLIESQPLPPETPHTPIEASTNETKPQPTVVQPTIANIANVERKPPELPNLKVSAIIINGDRKVAIIEGQRVTEGSMIGMEKVVEIKSDRVILQSGKNSRELALTKNRSAPLIVRKDR